MSNYYNGGLRKSTCTLQDSPHPTATKRLSVSASDIAGTIDSYTNPLENHITRSHRSPPWLLSN